MEFIAEDALQRMDISEVCVIRKSLNKVIARIRKDFRQFDCTKYDEKYYKRHLNYSEIVDQTISRKLRQR